MIRNAISTRPVRAWLLSSVVALGLSSPLALPTAAQAAEAAAATRPKLDGVWRNRGGRPLGDDMTAKSIPFQPWSRALFDKSLADNAAGTPYNANRERCLPQGVDIMFVRYNTQLIETPKIIYILSEWGNEVRRVFMDQTPPKTFKPSWNGHSYGRWEGSTLVIDTYGFNARTNITTDILPPGRTNLTHTDKLHLTERLTWSADGKSFRNELTFDDPGAFTKPWTNVQNYDLQTPDTKIFEFVCADSPLDLNG